MRVDITRYWYDKSLHVITFVLLPFSYFFYLITCCRRWLYRVGLFKSFHFSTPVIVVGNIAVGGTGKTPLVIWLAHFLREQGYKPGIVSGGYGGKKQSSPFIVSSDSKVADVGDEAILLARNSGCPVVIGVDRVEAVRKLLQSTQCNIVISDDGLQHFRLARNIEIAVVDGVRRFGNQQLLPAGPLRETMSRMKYVDFAVVNGGNETDKFCMNLIAHKVVSIRSSVELPIAEFKSKNIHAVAGIGNPARFFNQLKLAGFKLIEHAFQDHYAYQANDLQFKDTLPIVMTEKDAVKCGEFADERYWYLPVTAELNDIFQHELLAKLNSMESSHDAESDFAKHTCRNNHVVQRDDISE